VDPESLREYLATLGVSADCSDHALTQAYRDLVKVWHPDRFAHDERLRLKAEEQLKLISNAYELLRKYRRETSSSRARPSSDSSRSSGPQQPSDVVFCANCGVSLRVPEGATYLRCPSCKHEQDRNGAPRPHSQPAQPEDTTVDDTSDTEVSRTPRRPNGPFHAPVGMLAVGLAFGFLVIAAMVSSNSRGTAPKGRGNQAALHPNVPTAPTRVEPVESVEQAALPSNWRTAPTRVEPTGMASIRQLTKQGRAPAQIYPGPMYANGTRVAKEDTPAVSWYRQVAEQGIADAQYNLALMYDSGRGVPQDDAQAVVWYRKAAEQGHANAQFNLGAMYQDGRGVPRNKVLAHMWFNLAASRETGTIRDLMSSLRDVVAVDLSPAQVADAQRRAREWQEAFEKRKP